MSALNHQAFGLIVRRINDEPYDVPSVPGSRAVTIKFIIPNSRMGSVIGKGGSKIKEIQEASGARLNASEAMLPGSTEVRLPIHTSDMQQWADHQRVLSVSGVADAVHIAVYYIGTILLEYQERNPGAVTGSYRQTGARGSHSGPSAGPAAAPGPGAQTQQIFIPNSLVGASKCCLSISSTAYALGVRRQEFYTDQQSLAKVDRKSTRSEPNRNVRFE